MQAVERFVPGGNDDCSSLALQRKSRVKLTLFDPGAIVSATMSTEAARDDQWPWSSGSIKPFADRIEQKHVLDVRRGLVRNPDGDDVRFRGNSDNLGSFCARNALAVVAVAGGQSGAGRAVAI